jgi:hypothetical protein
LTKLFPTPRIPTEKIPECQPHIKRGEHKRVYRFSPDDYREIVAVFNGPRPGTGEELEVVEDAPEGALPNDLPPQTAVFAPGYQPKEIEIAARLRSSAGLPEQPTGTGGSHVGGGPGRQGQGQAEVIRVPVQQSPNSHGRPGRGYVPYARGGRFVDTEPQQPQTEPGVEPGTPGQPTHPPPDPEERPAPGETPTPTEPVPEQERLETPEPPPEPTEPKPDPQPAPSPPIPVP